MTRRKNVKPKASNTLNVEKLMDELQKEEATHTHRKGTFKVDKTFEEAIDTLRRTQQEK